MSAFDLGTATAERAAELWKAYRILLKVRRDADQEYIDALKDTASGPPPWSPRLQDLEEIANQARNAEQYVLRLAARFSDCPEGLR